MRPPQHMTLSLELLLHCCWETSLEDRQTDKLLLFQFVLMIRSFEIQCKSWPSAPLSASRAAHCRSYNVFQSNWAYLFRYRKWKKQTNNAVLCNGTLSLLRHFNVSLPRTIFPRSRKAHMSPSFFPTLLPPLPARRPPQLTRGPLELPSKLLR